MHNFNTKIYGHEQWVKTLYSLAITGNLPNVLLLRGPAGIGKTTLACFISRLLYLTKKKTVSVDQTTKSQSSMDAATKQEDCPQSPELNFDIENMWQSMAEIKTLPEQTIIVDSDIKNTTIPVEKIKNLQNQLFLTNPETVQRIIIIRNINALSTEAQNSLLKILEKPPNNTIFIIISHIYHVLSTIQSRCSCIELGKLSFDNISNILCNLGYDIHTPITQYAIAQSNGNIDRAITLIKTQKNGVYDIILELWASTAKNKDINRNILSKINEMLQKTKEHNSQIHEINEHIMSCLLYPAHNDKLEENTYTKKLTNIACMLTDNKDICYKQLCSFNLYLDAIEKSLIQMNMNTIGYCIFYFTTLLHFLNIGYTKK